MVGVGECKRASVEDAVGRPVAPWRSSGGLGDYRVGASEIVAYLPGRQAQEAAVPMAVERDLVAGGGDLGGELRPALDLLANEEEGCLYAGRAEKLEHSRSGLRMGSIVEGEQHPIGGVEAIPHSKDRAEWSANCGRARKPVCADREPCNPREQ